MRKNDVTLLIAVSAAALLAAGAGAFFLLSGDGGQPADDPYISFFFYDNHTNGIGTGLLSEGKQIADGIWVKGYGGDKAECFGDACRTFGADAVMSGGDIISFNGVSGDIHQMGWIYNGWSSDITLTSSETYPVRFMAIGHGASSASGIPPAPWQTPDDIRWYYGGSAAAGSGNAVRFYFYDNYENDPAAAAATFIADGYWVTGYGNSVADAFRDACSRLNRYVGYNDQTGEIFRLGDVSMNLCSLVWNNNEWKELNMSSSALTNGMYVAVGHGIVSGAGDLPMPKITPNDMKWSL